MSEFERIISDSMMAFEACNYVPHEEGLDLEDDLWDDVDDSWLDDFQGEEDFA